MVFDGARLRQRLIYLDTFINRESATQVVGELLFCEREKSGAEITLVIQSQGGFLWAMQAIHDTMQKISSPVSTMGAQFVGGAATILLMAGQPGARYIAKTCRIGLIPDIGIEETRPVSASGPVDELQSKMLNYVVTYTKLSSVDDYMALANRQEPSLSPEEAVMFGFVDHVRESE